MHSMQRVKSLSDKQGTRHVLEGDKIQSVRAGEWEAGSKSKTLSLDSYQDQATTWQRGSQTSRALLGSMLKLSCGGK